MVLRCEGMGSLLSGGDNKEARGFGLRGWKCGTRWGARRARDSGGIRNPSRRTRFRCSRGEVPKGNSAHHWQRMPRVASAGESCRKSSERSASRDAAVDSRCRTSARPRSMPRKTSRRYPNRSNPLDMQGTGQGPEPNRFHLRPRRS